MRALVVTLTVAAAGIWAAAAVGILYLVGAFQEPLVGRFGHSSVPDEPWPEQDVAGADPADLPRFPGSIRIEFTESAEASSLVTEGEYLVDAPLDDVVGHFETAFVDGAWTIRWAGVVRGEWTYELASPAGTDTRVEIEQSAGFVEVELEQRKPVRP